MAVVLHDQNLEESKASKVISLIRHTTLKSFEGLEEGSYDPWDEEENGAAWISNEASAVIDVFNMIYPEAELADEQWSTMNLFLRCEIYSVADCEQALSILSDEFLDLFMRVVAAGGSSNLELHETINNGDPVAVRRLLGL